MDSDLFPDLFCSVCFGRAATDSQVLACPRCDSISGSRRCIAMHYARCDFSRDPTRYDEFERAGRHDDEEEDE